VTLSDRQIELLKEALAGGYRNYCLASVDDPDWRFLCETGFAYMDDGRYTVDGKEGEVCVYRCTVQGRKAAGVWGKRDFIDVRALGPGDIARLMQSVPQDLFEKISILSSAEIFYGLEDDFT
jgi:hypothetical protein